MANLCAFSLQICGVWKNLPKHLLRQLQSEQMRVGMAVSASRREDVEGRIIKHRALFAGKIGVYRLPPRSR